MIFNLYLYIEYLFNFLITDKFHQICIRVGDHIGSILKEHHIEYKNLINIYINMKIKKLHNLLAIKTNCSICTQKKLTID